MQNSDTSSTDEPVKAPLEDGTTPSPAEESCSAEQEATSLEEDLLKMRETALRTAAEYDNYRKRVAREKEDIIRYANQRLLEELLPALDNFNMGMLAAKADESSMVYIGMSMVQKQFEQFLTDQGVKEIPSDGVLFDHNLHDAVGSEATGPETPENTILRVVRKGYMLKDRLLRPASVIVARHEEEENAQG